MVSVCGWLLFGNLTYFTGGLGQQQPACYSTKLFIALWLQAHDALTSQAVRLQAMTCIFWSGKLQLSHTRVFSLETLESCYCLMSLILLLCLDRGAEYCDQFVCLSVCVSICPRAYLWNFWTDLYEILCADPRGRGLVLLWRRCDMLCTHGLWITVCHIWL